MCYYRQSVDGVAIKLAAFQFFVLGGYYISTNNEEDTVDGMSRVVIERYAYLLENPFSPHQS